MLLQTLTIQDFRCYSNLTHIPFHRLTVVVGENDAGKTVLLNALEILLTAKRPSQDDYCKMGGTQKSETITISGTFAIDENNTIPEDYCEMDGSVFTLTKTFTLGTMKCKVSGRGFADSRYNTFSQQPAATQKELLENLGVSPASNEPGRIEQFQQAVSSKTLPKEAASLEVPFAQISSYLPRFQCISSVDYRHPDSLVQRTLQLAVAACLYPENPETGEKEMLPELVSIEAKIQAALAAEIDKIKEAVRQADPQLRDLQVNPTIDFARSVTANNLMLDAGGGLQFVDGFGEGRKKKLWMGLLECDRVVQDESEKTPVILAYDEPDVNLDYEAERQLFSSILSTTSKADSHVQAVVCTHAVTMVDSAPAQSINLIRATENGERLIDRLADDTDNGVKTFLATVGRTVGISNSALFYERAFLVVEGESEENALPKLYQHLYGRSLVEDRIVLINLRTCGAWKSVLNILLSNRAGITVLLLDQDCTQEGSGIGIVSVVIYTHCMVTKVYVCPHCQGSEGVVRFGFTDGARQRLRCKACRRTWTLDGPGRHLSAEKEALIEKALQERVSQRAIARTLSCGRATIRRVLKKSPRPAA